MRALDIFIFLFLVQIMLGVTKAMTVLSPQHDISPSMDVPKPTNPTARCANYPPVLKEACLFVDAFVTGVSWIWSLVSSMFMLGTTIDSLMPYRLPSALVNGLNVLGTIIAGVALYQLVMRFSTRMAE